jgi:endo-1,4-beta-D-glucanase Y
MTKSLTKEKNMTIKKRGRPLGVKNKPKAVKRTQVLTFEKQLEAWEKKENEVNYKELCEKLQEALAKSYVEAEQLERQIAGLQNEIGARDVIIRYLESCRG